MKKKEKILLISVMCLVIIYIIVNVVLPNLNRKTIYIGLSTRINIKNGHIYISEKDEKVNKQKVKIYFNNEIIDGYVLTEEESSSGLNNSLHAYNNEGEFLFFDSSLIAYTPDLKIKFIEINKDYTEEAGRISNFIKEDNIDLSKNELDYAIISSFDIDEDDESEYIYSIGLNQENSYESEVVMFKDNEYYVIAHEKGTVDEPVKLELVSIMDLDNDNDYEYIVSKSIDEYGSNKYEIYRFDGEDFIKIGIEE